MYLRESHQRGRSRWHIHLMHFRLPHGQLAMPGTHSETRPCASRGIELGSKTRFVLIGSFDGPEKSATAAAPSPRESASMTLGSGTVMPERSDSLDFASRI